MDCAIIILAAGGSARMGEPKQLLPFRNGTLLQHAIAQARQASAAPIFVVLGASYDPIARSLNGEQNIRVVHNSAWKQGIASSIRAGVTALMESDPDIGRALFLVCDQPYISASLLEAIMHLGTSSGNAIIASQYGEILGTPVLFCRSMFDQLQRLKGDNGARKVVLANMDQVATVPFPEGAIDIDTHDNYSQVMRQFALQ